jgi:ArsR family transcriptional regulator
MKVNSAAQRASSAPEQKKTEQKKTEQAEEARKVERLTRLFKALADETRVKIVAALSREELCVCHIEDALSCPQSTVSRHLAVLRSAGIVQARREGAWVYYSLKQQPPETAAHLQGITEQFAPPAVPPRRKCQ